MRTSHPKSAGARALAGMLVAGGLVAGISAGAGPARADADGAGGAAARLAGGFGHTVFLAADGVPYASGANDHGELTGPSGDKPALAPMAGLPAGVRGTGVAAGGWVSLVLASDGRVYGTGDNSRGQLTQTAQVRTLAPLSGLPAGVTATGAAVGNYHSVVLGSDGSVYGAGANDQGQLTGVGDRSTLAALTGLPEGVSATRVAAGHHETFVVGSDGIPYAAGDNTHGQLTGSGDRSTLTPMTGHPEGVEAEAVAGGDAHALVLGSDGVVYGTGYNANHQLTGTGTRDTLTPLTGLPEGAAAVAVAAGEQHSLVLGSDGVVYGTGYGAQGQLTGTEGAEELEPIRPAGTAVAVAAADRHTLVLDAAGVLHGTGFNQYGQIVGGGQNQTSFAAVAGQVLAMTSGPAVTGSATVGSTLVTSAGGWSPTPTAVTYQWSSGGAPVAGATSASYTVRPADIGRRLTVTVTTTRAGLASGLATSAATAIVPPASSTVRVALRGAPKGKVKAGRKAGKLQVTVSAAPASVPVTGSVRVVDTAKAGRKTTSRTLATRALAAGRATIKLPKLAKGKHTLVVHYLGSSTVTAAVAPAQRLTVR